MSEGLAFVYTGNVHDPEGDRTNCPGCGAAVIQRDWYVLKGWGLSGDDPGCCARCGVAIPGVFEAQPGTWGARRLRLRV